MAFRLAEDWEPWAAGKVRYLRRREVGQAAESGIWRGNAHDIPPGTPIRCKRNEYIYIISGGLKLEMDSGEIYQLEPGDCFGFAKGETVKWTLTSDELEEFYVYHD